MRIWLTPFEELDDKRILAQHNEIHALWSLIEGRRQNWGFLSDELGSWSDEPNRGALSFIHVLTQEEFAIRGYRHGTPMMLPARYPHQPEQLEYPPELVERDRWHLMLRWGGVFRGRTTRFPDAYARLAKKYAEQGGCLHDAKPIRNRGAIRCPLCKEPIMEAL